MPIVWIALPFILAFACYGEIKARRIPNWLTLGAMALGLGAAAIEGGTDGLVDSALGLAIAGGLFLPFCLLGVVGGGDMKLMAAIGAIVGWPMVLRVVTNTCIAGGLIAVALMAWHGVLLREVDSKALAGECKLKLSEVYPEDMEIAALLPGGVEKMPLCDMDRMAEEAYDHRLSFAIAPVRDIMQLDRFGVTQLMQVLERLRAPDGCP